MARARRECCARRSGPGAVPPPSAPPECGRRADQASARCRRRQKFRDVCFQELIDHHAVVGCDPALSASPVFGRTPIPTTTRSQSKFVPSSSSTSRSLNCCRRSTEMEFHAVPLVSFANQISSSRPRTFSSGSDTFPTTATSSLRSRNDHATSSPMKLAPITTARFAFFAFSMMRLLSVSVRK